MPEMLALLTKTYVPADDKRSFFEKFYGIKSALEHSSGSFEFGSSGLGLGLATARAILDAHGSSLEVKSELTKGSTFSFSLPAV